MVSVRSNSIRHIINVIGIAVVGYLSLYLFLLYKADRISSTVIPMVDGVMKTDDDSISIWLNSFDRFVYIMVGIILLIVIVRYIIETFMVTHEGTVVRTILFWALGTIINFAVLVYFFKVYAPVLEGDNTIILLYSLGTFVILYILMVAFVPSSIMYLMFPRNIIFKRK